jgi:hypothetical protein
LVQWRVGRHRAAIWKSLVLPAGGAGLCWLLLMTLWMPLLNYGQSYTTLVKRTVKELNRPGCVETWGLSAGQMAAFQFYGRLELKVARSAPVCPWMLAEPGPDGLSPIGVSPAQWVLKTRINHPVDGSESVLLFRRR